MNKIENEEFRNKVYDIVNSIPKGSVLTYGIIAFMANRPQNSRLVGRILSNSARNLTNHRVVNHMGRTVVGWSDQRKFLEDEGVVFKKNGCVDLKKHLWKSC